MRELYHIMVFWLCLMAFAACEVEFDFKELDGDPLFLLDGAVKSEPYSPSTSNFQMYLYAVPSAAGEREFSEEARCTLKVYRNSELIDTKDYITIQSFFGLIADEYPVKPGDLDSLIKVRNNENIYSDGFLSEDGCKAAFFSILTDETVRSAVQYFQ